MTPQERDLITALLARLKQQAGQSKDPEAEALIRQGMAAQPDAPYLLVQTVLIQDMALHDAERRIADLEREAQARPAQAPAATSFLSGRQGSVPQSGPWQQSAPPAAPAPGGSVWTQRGAAPATAAPAAGAPAAAAPMSPPQMLSGSGGGFLRQAAATAAGVAGGALLFQGIESLFGPHYGSGFLGAGAMQPGLSETVINNYYGDGDQNAPDTSQADFQPDQNDVQDADFQDDGGQDQDFSGGDSGDFSDDGGNYDV
jgi:uncharacterized protein